MVSPQKVRVTEERECARTILIVAILCAATPFFGSTSWGGPPCRDLDDDGYADCTVPNCNPNNVICGDCDDHDFFVNPDATEICNQLDENCDGFADDGFVTLTSAVEVRDPEAMPGDNYGSAVAGIGDVTGDGVPDFAVGIPRDDPQGRDSGSVALFSGSDHSLICKFVDPDGYSTCNLGHSVAGIGDVSGDGVPDVLAGSPGYGVTGVPDSGSVLVFSGADCAFIHQLLEPAPNYNEHAGAELGISVAAIDDVTGDGVPDVVAGAHGERVGGYWRAGSVLVFSGADGTFDRKLVDAKPETQAFLGASVAVIDDITGDGVPEILAGSSGYPEDPVLGAGAVLLFSGAGDPFIRRHTDPVPVAGAALGASVAALADVTGDGVPDIVAGSPHCQVASTDVGCALVFSGADGGYVRRLTDPDGAFEDELGGSVTSAADITGDGVPEIAVGAAHDDDGSMPDAGSIVVFDGSSGAVTEKLLDPTGGSTALLGLSVAALGDLNGDGRVEIAGGAPGADIEGEGGVGRVVLFSFESDCDSDGAGPFGGDCDDTDPNAYPGATELCDVADNDCDGLTDEDDDGDGHAVCDECADSDPTRYPGAEEICNGLDDDCDTEIDEGVDDDDDTYTTPCDCDDDNVDRNPGATEICNHTDDDCDGAVDEGSDIPLSAESIVNPFVEGDSVDRFGTAVARVGDVTGDGIDDIVVGASDDDPMGDGSGSAVLLSGSDRALVCRMIDPSGESGDSLGISVAGIEDVSGDGVPDILAGASGYDTPAGTDAGAVLVFSGTDCSFVMTLTDTAGAADDFLGTSVAGIQDFTGDEVPDIVAGSPGRTVSGLGEVLVISGDDGSVAMRLTDPYGSAGDRLGISVAGIGDVTRDGVPDIVSGAFRDNAGGGEAGSVLVFSGADGAFVRKLFNPDGNYLDSLGISVAGIGDVTGDGYEDIAAGAPDSHPLGISDAGSVIVFSGADGSLIRILTDPAGALDDFLGSSVTGIGDVTGDGIPDIAAGASGDDHGAVPDGGSVVVFSGVDGSVVLKLTPPSAVDGDELGSSVVSLGDTDGDGLPEIVSGAPGHDVVGNHDRGRILVFSLESDCDGDGWGPFGGDCDDANAGTHPWAEEVCDLEDNDCDTATDEDDDGDGFAVCDECADTDPTRYPGAEEVCNGLDDDCDTEIDEGVDVDGDTFTTPCDCADGDPDRHPGATEVCNHLDDNCDGLVDEGSTTLVSMDAIVNSNPEGDGEDEYGSAVAGIEDVDGDGIPDILIGAYKDDPMGDSSGGGAILSGADRSLLCRLIDPAGASGDYLGFSVAEVGDVTGDGVADVVAGAYGRDTVGGDDAGEALIFSGADCSLVHRLIDPAGAAGDRLGRSVAGIGDVTGDGVPDILAGASYDDNPAGNDSGSVSLFSGASGSFVRKSIDPSGALLDYLGCSVAGIDDVTGDGIPDIVTGAYGDDTAGGDEAGSVLVFSGADGSLVRKSVDPQGGFDDYLGFDVAVIGDVTGDYIPDYAAGAYLDDQWNKPETGAVVVFSGADGTYVRKLLDSSGASGDKLGYSVAGPGDLTGDGIPDIVAGVPYQSGIDRTGAVVVFSGADGAAALWLTAPVDGFLGKAVASAGDLTGDGIPEIVAGAPSYGASGFIRLGSAVVFSVEADCDGDGVGTFEGDCDDQNAQRYAGAEEVCDVQDNDCDGMTDEDDDGDGYAVCDECADTDPLRYPGAEERCNGLDDDCDTEIDEGEDLDGDTHTTPCDCADGDPDRYPGATETCNHLDDDCDGGVDEGTTSIVSLERKANPEGIASDQFGVAVAEIPDVTADGIADLLAGAPYDDTTASNAGSVTVLSGADRSVVCRALDPGGRGGDNLGISVAAVGDVTGDDVPDFAAGAVFADVDSVINTGSVVVFSGADCTFVRRLTDPTGEASDYLGRAVAGIGDVTGDGVPDIVAGADRDDTVYAADAGSVIAFSGADGSMLWKQVDADASDSVQLGSALARVGDVDGDGWSDVAAGARQGDYGAGRVLVFSGADGTPRLRLQGGTSGDQVGFSVAGIGDVTGDGVPDIAAGSPYDDYNAVTNSGSVLVYSGADATLVRTLTDPDAVAADNLGYSVTGLDDLTGDGVPEIAAGVPGDDTGDTPEVADAGSVVVFDGATGTVIRKLWDPFGNEGDRIGHSLAAAGDPNGDTIPEVLAGAPMFDQGPSADTGSVVVFSLETDCDGDLCGPFCGDCDDSNIELWGIPGDTSGLRFEADRQTLGWDPPLDLGQSAGWFGYDTLRADDPLGFGAATCIETDGPDLTSQDPDSPLPGDVYYYLVRAENDCGQGGLGSSSEGTDRTAASCP